jgi:hypothetical protein
VERDGKGKEFFLVIRHLLWIEKFETIKFWSANLSSGLEKGNEFFLAILLLESEK